MRSWIFASVALALMLMAVLPGCRKEEAIETPAVTTLPATEIGPTSAVSGGSVFNRGSETIISRGIVWNDTYYPNLSSYRGFTTEGGGAGSFSSQITGLAKNSICFVRAYATTSSGTFYGDEEVFRTLADLPILTTSFPGEIGPDSASCSAVITDDGGLPILENGICWTTAPHPTLYNSHTSEMSGTAMFSSTIKGLTPGTTYTIRAFARNGQGLAYGNEISFTTSEGPADEGPSFNPTLVYGEMTDIEGNTYRTIQIGNQTWMAENLRTTTFRNGDPVPCIQGENEWKNLTTAAYCDYNDEAGLAQVYGKLYNWYAVEDSRNLAPEGWHIASNEEWETMISYLGGNDIAAGKLRETGSAHWATGNEGSTNESGFTALPGGFLLEGMGYLGIGSSGWWWSSDEVDSYYASYWMINTFYDFLNRYGYDKGHGGSVRCIKD